MFSLKIVSINFNANNNTLTFVWWMTTFKTTLANRMLFTKICDQESLLLQSVHIFDSITDFWNISELGYTKAVVQRCSVKNVFLEISQNSHENTCARVSLSIKLQASGYIKNICSTNLAEGQPFPLCTIIFRR